MRPRSVELHIEELTLDAVSPADRDRVAASVSRELERLLGAQPIRMGGQATVVDIDAGEVLPTTHGPEALGTSIAGAIHRRLVR